MRLCYTYVIQSEKDGQWYTGFTPLENARRVVIGLFLIGETLGLMPRESFLTGFTNDIRKRIQEHNKGLVFSTKGRCPWRLIYYEGWLNEKDARAREKYLKSGMGKRYIRNRLKFFLRQEL